jgi:hypothetical protein
MSLAGASSDTKIKIFGREFDKPSTSDLLGDIQLKPKIVENTGRN